MLLHGMKRNGAGLIGQTDIRVVNGKIIHVYMYVAHGVSQYIVMNTYRFISTVTSVLYRQIKYVAGIRRVASEPQNCFAVTTSIYIITILFQSSL